MNTSSLTSFLKDALVELAARAVEEFARGLAAWVVERIERLVGAVADRMRGHAHRQRAAGVDEQRLSARITDSLLDALDSLRADLLRRRESMTAEQALSMFEAQLSPGALAL